MKKYIFYLLVFALFFFSGCEEKEDYCNPGCDDQAGCRGHYDIHRGVCTHKDRFDKCPNLKIKCEEEKEDYCNPSCDDASDCEGACTYDHRFDKCPNLKIKCEEERERERKQLLE